MDNQSRLDKNAPSVESLQAAVESRPADRQAKVSLGWELYALKRDAEAVEAFEAAEKMDAADPEASYGLGLALRRVGQLDEARRAFQAVIDNAAKIENLARSTMFMRLAKGQISFIDTGDWHLEGRS